MKVACICLTCERPGFLERAVACYKAQTHQEKTLVVVDTSKTPLIEKPWMNDKDILYIRPHSRMLLGELRNFGIEHGEETPLIATWDDDDWSHAKRLEEQVKHLQLGEYWIVGYRDMLFYSSNQRPVELHLYSSGRANTHLGVGTSFMFTREAWLKARKYPAVAHQEDQTFQHRFPVAKRGFHTSVSVAGEDPTITEPRMIAEIHGSNTMNHVAGRSHNWARIVDQDLIADVERLLGYRAAATEA